MAASDSSAQNVRFNLDAQQLEFALGTTWTAIPVPLPALTDNQKLVFGNSSDAWIEFESASGEMRANSASSGAWQIHANTDVTVSANGGSDGMGAFEPSLSLGSTGGIQMTSNTGTDDFVLSLISTTKGFLPPRMTTTQRDAIATPDEGLTIYNTTTHAINFYNGTAWKAVAGA